MKIRKNGKKQNVLDAAVQVFAQSGYHNAKMSKIAEVAGVGAGSLYLYYRNKQHILEEIFIELWQELADNLDSLTAREDLTPIEKLDAQTDLIFDRFIHNADMAIVFVTEFHQQILQEKSAVFPYIKRFMEATERLFIDGQKAGLFNPHINPRILVHFVFGGARRLLFEWAKSPEQFSLGEIRQDLKLLIRRGVLPGPPQV